MIRYDINYKKRNMVIKQQQYISNNNVIDSIPFDDDDDDEFEDLIMMSDHVEITNINNIEGEKKTRKNVVLERRSLSCIFTFVCRTLLLSISIMIVCLWITTTRIPIDYWYNDNDHNSTDHIHVTLSINKSNNDHNNDTNISFVDLLRDNDELNDNKQLFLNGNTTKVNINKAFSVTSNSFISVDDRNNNSKFKKSNGYHNNTIILNATYDNIIETVEVTFHDLKYRKVCTSIGMASILCMIIRFPFLVPLQQSNDTAIRYPKPVTEQFYKQDKNNIYTIKQNDWFQCNNNDMIIADSNDSIIQQCLDNMAIKISNQRHDKQEPVVSMWTRQRSTSKNNNNEKGNQEIIFHGTGHHDAIHNAYQFFGNDHEIVVVGASPAPGVTEALHMLFGSTCHETNVHRKPNYNCDNTFGNNKNKPMNRRKRKRRQRRNLIATNNDTNKKKLLPFTLLEEGHINIGIVDYRLISGNGKHIMPNYTVLQALDNIVLRPDGWNINNNITLRNFSLIVEYPFAHVQSQDMINNNELYTTIQSHQTILPSYFMEFVSDYGKQHLQSIHGYQFQYLFTFDGLPQFFPTVTSAFTKYLYPVRTEYGIEPSNFTYPGWHPDYGTNCRGPLPSNSLLREINIMSRQSFMNSELNNNRWYGRTWEFVNLYWWQTKMYFGEHGLDCTHSGGRDGLYGLHKFFIQAMIDDYFENQ